MSQVDWTLLLALVHPIKLECKKRWPQASASSPLSIAASPTFPRPRMSHVPGQTPRQCVYASLWMVRDGRGRPKSCVSYSRDKCNLSWCSSHCIRLHASVSSLFSLPLTATGGPGEELEIVPSDVMHAHDSIFMHPAHKEFKLV